MYYINKLLEFLRFKKKQQKKEILLHFIFVTRCFKPNNIQRLKDNLKAVFANQTDYSYQHLLVVDLTRGNTEQMFNPFIDDHTTIHFVTEKKKNDTFIVQGVDSALQKIDKNDAYVYMLDDDNLIRDNFLDICKEINKETDDVIIVKIYRHSGLGSQSLLQAKSAVGGIDWANFITKLIVMKRTKLYRRKDSHLSDGHFFDRVKKDCYNIKFSKQVVANYNIINKP